jgi:class 3 adenylate cyclase
MRAERRKVTLLFADMVGLRPLGQTRAGARRGAERNLREMTAEAVSRGTLDNYIGDGLMVLN